MSHLSAIELQPFGRLTAVSPVTAEPEPEKLMEKRVVHVFSRRSSQEIEAPVGLQSKNPIIKQSQAGTSDFSDRLKQAVAKMFDALSQDDETD